MAVTLTFLSVAFTQFTATTVTVSPNATASTISISDDDKVFDFDDANQVLAEPITIYGTTYPAGTRVEHEYEVVLKAPDGTLTRMIAVSVNGNSSQLIGALLPDADCGGEILTPGTTYTVVSSTSLRSEPYDSFPPVCFTPGVMIRTPSGERPVETLDVGDMVETYDHGPQPVRMVAHRRMRLARGDDRYKPVRIGAGALGNGRPEADLLVSPHHRMLMTDPEGREVLVAAKALTSRPGIRVMRGRREVHYIHLVFDAHEVVVANGALTESLLPGPEALKSVPRETALELREIFPQLLEGPVAPGDLTGRTLLPVGRSRRLAHRLRAAPVPGPEGRAGDRPA